MVDNYSSITTAIGLLESALQMRYPDEVRRNVNHARDELLGVVAEIDTAERTTTGPGSVSAGTARVMISCPVNGDDVATDIEIDEATFAAATFDDRQLKCSSCEQWHQWSKSAAFLR